MRDPDLHGPPIEYEDFNLRLLEDHRGGAMVYIQHATGGGGTARLELDRGFVEGWMEETESWIRDGRSSGDARARLRQMGEHLFDTLFRDHVLRSFRRSLAHRERTPHQGLRLRLVFDVEHENTARLAALPWELLFDPESETFLARNRFSPLVRFLDARTSFLPLAAEPPLRLLIVGASPTGLPHCAIERECSDIAEALKGHENLLHVERVPGESFAAFVDALTTFEPHAVHFSGHGEFHPDTGESYLAFSDGDEQDEQIDFVPGSRFAKVLHGFRSVRLVVLTACESATFSRQDGVDPYSSVAAALVREGIPATVAMQFPIGGRAAVAFSRSLYSALARGRALDTAVTEGRLSLYARWPEAVAWAVPALYMRSSQGQVLTGVVDAAPPAESIRQRILPYEAAERMHELTDGFVGRDFVFDRVDDFLREASRGYLTIEGEPGIGKSALVAELVRRHRLVYHLNSRTAGICRHEAFLAHVCAQLIVRYRLPHGSLPSMATDDAGFLMRLLREARDRDPDGRLVLLVDALDEVDRSGLPPGANPLFLPTSLPQGVYAVLTSRPAAQDARPHFTCEQDRLRLLSGSTENLHDVRRYLEGRLGAPGLSLYRRARGLSETDFVESLVERSEGNFMYLHHVLPELGKGRYDDLSLDDLPSGLKGYYNLHWQRMRGSTPEEVWLGRRLPVLIGLARARAPINVQVLTFLSGNLDPRWVRMALREWRAFLDVGEVVDGEGRRHTVYSIYHKSFHDFLTEQEEITDVFLPEERQILLGASRRLIDAASAHDSAGRATPEPPAPPAGNLLR